MTLRVGPEGPRVRGRVRDELGAPVAGAYLFAGYADEGNLLRRAGVTYASPPPQAAVTDQHGRFELGAVSTAAQLPLWIAADGFALAREEVTAERAARALEIVLVREARVTGLVRDGGGAPLELAEVRAWPEGAGREPMAAPSWGAPTAWTSSSGSFQLVGLRPGPTVLCASVHGLGEARASVVLAAGETATWLAEVRPAEELAGSVVDERGAPLDRLGGAVPHSRRRVRALHPRRPRGRRGPVRTLPARRGRARGRGRARAAVERARERAPDRAPARRRRRAARRGRRGAPAHGAERCLRERRRAHPLRRRPARDGARASRRLPRRRVAGAVRLDPGALRGRHGERRATSASTSARRRAAPRPTWRSRSARPSSRLGHSTSSSVRSVTGLLARASEARTPPATRFRCASAPTRPRGRAGRGSRRAPASGRRAHGRAP